MLFIDLVILVEVLVILVEVYVPIVFVGVFVDTFAYIFVMVIGKC